MAALRDLRTDVVSVRVVEHIEELFRGADVPVVAAIDIPIGLMDAGRRACDGEARHLLKGHASSVFNAPIRPVLDATTPAEANKVTMDIAGFGLSVQSFGIVPKIREVDRFLRERGQGGLREAHPEIAFLRMNNWQPLMAVKKSSQTGRDQRASLLRKMYGNILETPERQRSGYKLDDLYDALAVLETARRINLGIAQRVPELRVVDSCGLPMEIWY